MKLSAFYLIIIVPFFACAQLPKGFVYVKDVIPDLDVELRYYSNNNFVGQQIEGYNSNTLILTQEAAEALKKVHTDIQDMNLCLKVYDGYRPQQAVNHFIRWARNIEDTINKKRFYPNVNKRNLFKAGYISSKSGHSKGSTIDLTITDGSTGVPVDMGSPYDFFGEESWVNHDKLTQQQKDNRQLLQNIMRKHGFRGYDKEWWHFTLRNQPYPKTFFNFSID
ncbi:MAG: M15 family metallopeptidase [Aestuariibaculum sp.]